ncbi:DUF6777 domain-containing protein [Mycolicibacterium sp. ND9-15]|uniref:DUF6777 domain-containing protein n=1 Tax=Mycolicibacterium sp. ND9-15 TaxID=3042320 RepID=UPI002DD94777|nr:DUF6777 domain-containing protein [Mycolicibacterium sp. ND9-15]WSE55804.1 DUF6777 domain-containing protein [Mycolicibacterium sp. ND9-15]
MADHPSSHDDSTPENTSEQEVTQASPTQSQPTVHRDEADSGAPTEMIGRVKTGPGLRDRTTRRVLMVSAAVVLVATLAFGLTQIIRKDAPPVVEETAAAEVFLEPADSAGDSPFAPTSFATAQPDPTTPGTDPLGPPPAAPPPAPDGQAAPMTLRTANGDLPGLYGGTLDTTTCDVELMINYLDANQNKAKAWASVHRVAPNQIRAYVTELTPVLLRTDTRVTDHGYIEVAQAIPRQAVLQAGTAVLVDKYGSPRARCISGSPLLDPIAVTTPAPRRAGNAPVPPPARPAWNAAVPPPARPGAPVAVQPVAAPARARVVFVGPRWPRFDPLTIVVIRRVARAIEWFLLWDFRRGTLFARRIGNLIRDIANLFDPRLARIVPANLLANLRAGRPALVPPPLQPPLPRGPARQAPGAPAPAAPAPGAPAPAVPAPGQAPAAPAPGQAPAAPAPGQAPAAPQGPAPAPQAPQAPAPVQQPAAPPVAPPPVFVDDGPVSVPPPLVDSWDEPPVADPGISGGHPEGIVPQQPMPAGDMPEHQPQIADSTPSDGGYAPGHVSEDPGVYVPPVDGSNTNPDYPELPAPSSGGHDTAPIQDAPAEIPQDTGSYDDPGYQQPLAPDSGGHETAPIQDAPAELPQDSGGYTSPDYGSLPGASDSGGDPGGSLQCDPVLNPC